MEYFSETMGLSDQFILKNIKWISAPRRPAIEKNFVSLISFQAFHSGAYNFLTKSINECRDAFMRIKRPHFCYEMAGHGLTQLAITVNEKRVHPFFAKE